MRSKFKILHLEDVRADAELAARELRRNNLHFEHLIIDTEAEYRAALATFQPDIILCDHSLPAFNSREALHIKRMQQLPIPFILLTATMTDEVALGLVRDGADDYVLKDRLTRLPNAVMNALDKYGLEQERQQLIERVTTKEAEAQNALKQAANKILLATKAAGIGVWDYFIEEGRMECDDFLRSLYGSRGRELDGTFASWLNVVDAADRANVAREVMACRMTRNYLDVTFRVSIPNDPILYLRATGIIESDASGAPYRMIGTIQDVTERMLSDQAIRASEAFTQGILNSLSSHIAVVARDGLIVRVNQSWRAFADSNEPLRDFEYNEGANYFDACLKSNDPDALMTLAQMKEVLEGARKNMYKEYPCHAPDVQRWYCMRVTPFESGGLPLLLIEHQNITERKLAEDKLLSTTRALQQTLHELHKIMDSSPDIICTVDNEGRFISVSAAATHILGYAPGELVGEKYIDFVFGDDIAYTNEVAALLMTGINFTNFENRYVRKNGTVVPILWSAQWDAEDKTIHCIAKDATEKKRLESAFEAEQQRFASLFEQAPSCIGVFKGPEHHFEMANPLFLQITGKKDLIGKPVRTVLPELEGQGVFELLDRVYNTGTSVSGKEIPIKIDRHGTGALLKIYSNFVYQPYTNTLGVVEGIFFFSVDVTEQVLTRKKLEENEKNYSLLFHSSPLPQYISDKKTLRLIEVNAQALKQYGYTRREFLNKTSSDLQLKEHNTARPEVLERSAKANAPFSNLVCHTNKKGDQMLVEIKSSSINYHGIPATLTSVSDMTGEVRLQTKIVDLKIAAQKEITQAHIKGQELERAFIGRELHDNINQQLTTAKLYLDLAKDKEDLRLDLLGKSENVIQNTINEIRSLSKSFMVPTQKELSLEDALNELITTYAEFETMQFHLKSHACIKKIDEEMKLMFYRIIQEQLNNIVKHARCKNVWIEFAYARNNIRLKIRDDGKGFNLLRKNSGIGLSNIRVRLELYHGTMHIETAPNKGCTISISVPKIISLRSGKNASGVSGS